MSPKSKAKGRRWRWTAATEEAALLVSQDVLTDEQIAKKVGVSKRTLERWKLRSSFRKRVEALVAEVRATLKARGVLEKQNRLDAINGRWTALHQVIEERGQELRSVDVPGWKTGLLVRHYKVLGQGKDQHLVEEYEVDTGLLRSCLEHEKQAAIELGEWKETLDLGGELAIKGYINVSPDDWDE